MRENTRLAYIDIAKGIAIIAVVIGHSFPDNLYFECSDNVRIVTKVIYDFCYTWHMLVLSSLFMIIIGIGVSLCISK